MGRVFIAQIYMLTTEEGGRNHPALSGWRPLFSVSERENWSISVGRPDEQIFELGQSYEVELRFIFDDPLGGHPEIGPGSQFKINEGRRTSARGEIIRRVLEEE